MGVSTQSSLKINIHSENVLTIFVVYVIILEAVLWLVCGTQLLEIANIGGEAQLEERRCPKAKVWRFNSSHPCQSS